MEDRRRNKEQLVAELAELRRRIAELETFRPGPGQTDEHGRRSASLPDLNPNPVIEVDASGTITFLNHATEKALSKMGMNKGDVKVFLPDDLGAILGGQNKKGISSLAREVTVKDKVFSEHICFAPHHNTAIIYLNDITDHKQAVRAARQLPDAAQEEKNTLSSLLNCVQDEVWVTDKSGRFTLVNESALREFDLDLSTNEMDVERLALSLEVYRPDGSPRPLYETPPLRALAGEIVRNQEEMIRIPSSGEVRYREVSASPVRDVTGSIIGSVSVVRDVTDRKRAEERLRESENRFRAIADYTYDCENWFDVNGRLVWVNAGVYRLTGYTIDECMAMSDFPLPLFVEEDRDRFVGYFAQARQGLSANDVEFRIRCKDGSRRWVAASWQPMYDANGSCMGHRSSIRDITTRKKTEQQLKGYEERLEKLVDDRTKKLQKSEERYRNIFENAVEGIFQTTPEGRFLRANPALAQMYGYESPEELVGSVANIATEICSEPEQRENFRRLIEKDGLVRNFEMHVRTRNESIKHVCLNARAVRDESGKTLYFEGTAEDITEKKLAAEQMRLQRDLAVKLAQVDDLQEGLALILQTAVSASGMESGGIFLKNNETGNFDLAASVGFARKFQDTIRRVPPESSLWPGIMAKASLHAQTSKHLTPVAFKEGFQILSHVAVLEDNEVIGSLLMYSRVLTAIPEQVRIGLELLGAESGSSIARIKAREKLQHEISVHKEAERELRLKSRNLEEVNTALRVLLEQREKDKNDLEERMLFNVKKLVFPYLDSLKQRRLDDEQKAYLEILETNLKNIISPFAKKLTSIYENFTPQEIKVADLLRDGKTIKEIAQTLGVSESAINLHRQHIRNKLGLKNQKINLRTYLLSLTS